MDATLTGIAIGQDEEVAVHIHAADHAPDHLAVVLDRLDAALAHQGAGGHQVLHVAALHRFQEVAVEAVAEAEAGHTRDRAALALSVKISKSMPYLPYCFSPK